MDIQEKLLKASCIANRENVQHIKSERQLIKLITKGENITVSGRELHEFLEVKTEYKKWFSRMTEYGFDENLDYRRVTQKCHTLGGIQEIVDHEIKLDMAKEIAMIQRNEKGKQARQYFIQVEKFWNTPEMIMKRANDILNNRIDMLKIECFEKDKVIEEQKPKVIFADAVSTSKTSILVGELAKILRQNEIAIGPNKLFIWLRDNGYLIKRKGTDWNMPTQRSMEQGLFEIKESTHLNGDGVNVTTKTPKVTGKGQQYFINKFLNKED